MSALHFRGGLVSSSPGWILKRVVALLGGKPRCQLEKKEI